MGRGSLEKEIDLIDLFWTVCMNWRRILAITMIFVVLSGIISAVRGIKVNRSIEDAKIEDIELPEIARTNIKRYFEYLEIYEAQLAFVNNAPLMQLDSQGFYVGKVTYYVDNHFEVEYPLYDSVNNVSIMIEAYQAGLRSREFIDHLAEITGGTEENSIYLVQLVDGNNQYGNIVTDIRDTTGVMTISVYGADEASCTKILTLVKETIEASYDMVVEQLGEHDITLLQEVCNYVADNQLLVYQKDNLDKLANYKDSITRVRDSLAEDELIYVELYEGILLDDEDINPGTSVISFSFSFKIVILGFLLGFVFACFYEAMCYIFDKKLRINEDVESLYGVKLFGYVNVENEKKRKFAFIDQLIIKLRYFGKRQFSEEEAILMAAAGIKISAKKADTAKIFVTGADSDLRRGKVVAKLLKELKSEGIEVIDGKPILYDAEALEYSAEVGYVVLVETAGVSMYGEVAKELETCSYQGIKVLGMVMVG